MPLILPARTLDSGYEVSNSLRFNDDDSAVLSRTTTSSGNANTFTFSFWLKRANLTGSNQYIFNFTDGHNDNLWFGGLFHSDNSLMFQSWFAGTKLDTNRLFRDPSAWYHIVLAVDTTQSTSSNRLKIYVNGVQQTDLATSTFPAQNFNFTGVGNSGTKFVIGALENDTPAFASFYDGYISDFNFIDGTAKAPTDFGETNDNGVWIPKKYDGSYGTNGFFLEFKQTGTGTNASGMGADTSGNTNHFAVTNLTATDVTTDTPTNNFATMNSLVSISTLSEGNCKAVTTNGERMAGPSTLGFANGKWYMEYKITDINSINVIVGIDNDSGRSFHEFSDNVNFWDASNSYGYQNDGNKRTTGVQASYGNSYTTGDIIGIAVDMDNRKIYFSKNGTYQNSGDPTTGSTGTGSAFDLTDGLTYFFQAADQDSASGFTVEANFGQPSFSISSGNADANGHGNFEFAVPSGYFALCTKNLAEYG
jgi:hypothetical protein